MTDLALPAQTKQQPEAGLRAGEMPVNPILESLSAWQHVGEPIAAPGGLGGSKRLSTTANESVTAPSATIESRAKKLSAPKEHTALPDASKGMVGPAIWPPSP